MTEQLAPLSAEDLVEIRDYYTAQIVPECPVRGDELIIGRVLQMLDEHTRLGATLRALEARVELLRALVKAKEKLHTAYRLGSHDRADTALTEIERVEAELEASGND